MDLVGQGGILRPDVSDITGPKIPAYPTKSSDQIDLGRSTPACGESTCPDANLMITATIGLPSEWSGNGATIGDASCAVPGSPTYPALGTPLTPDAPVGAPY
ncbi:hypothetical protein Prum_033370 [Phytohabitans rumicis]|uniref:Uncharacterized protein n=1 Tax=Phytohabitans rumicis TaxID=1076125 RepID=A0A6V8LAH5_9ACTN|nr:hypothetical protein Prum_033370 [Phytohabitans rumicis]